jgi:hypothetical protein
LSGKADLCLLWCSPVSRLHSGWPACLRQTQAAFGAGESIGDRQASPAYCTMKTNDEIV